MVGKYVISNEGQIYIFSANVMHSTFAHLQPTSAGFIRFFVTDNQVTCKCYGESESLNLKSNPEFDTKIASRFLLCNSNSNSCGICGEECQKHH